jgi:glutamyl-tRNA(Gln) amidotransferase subunit E
MISDYQKIGLKVGLEIHQQLNTKAKLFCGCPPALFKEEPEITFLRRLRPTQSELGQVEKKFWMKRTARPVALWRWMRNHRTR